MSIYIKQKPQQDKTNATRRRQQIQHPQKQEEKTIKKCDF